MLRANIVSVDNKLYVSGEMDFSTVSALWEQSLPLMTHQTHLQFDFSKIQFANSAALALLLEWLKYAKTEKKTIHFDCLPAKLLSVASIAGLEGLLCSQKLDVQRYIPLAI